MILGIDLGTTNCACAVFRQGVVEMVPNSLGHTLTPSAVSVGDNGEILTGLAARERQSTHPDVTATAFKRYMGSAKKIELGRQSFSPEELSALMLASLKRDAEAWLGQPVSEAVITVPAYFNDKQRKATRQAGILAGLKVERLINEPTAAALAYGIHKRDQRTRFLVFDLGGGTFDVSLLEIYEGVIEVRASAGDNRLGGEDFNETIIEMARNSFDRAISNAIHDENALYQRAREAAERARRKLSEADQATFSVIWRQKAYETAISAEAFEEASAPLLARLREPVLRSLRDSGVVVDGIDEIVLVGGATRMPMVRRAVTRMFGRFPSATVNPDEAVAHGAAIQAALKDRDQALAEVVLTDVCPFSLGVESTEGAPHNLVAGVFTPILERNCVIPTSREKTFSTLRDNQPSVVFPIYQGESRWARDNILLGKLDIPVPRAKAGETAITCRFSYDINGLLEVDLHVPSTGERRQLVLTDEDALTPEQLTARREALAKLKVHPRDTDAMRAARSRAERCYENHLGSEREAIGLLIIAFEQVLSGQDPRACEAARTALNAQLDEIEGSSLL